MKYTRMILVIFVSALVSLSQAKAQVSLYPEVSAETNGMGATGVSFVSDNALATIANPAELGMFSLNGMLSASYMPNIPNQLNSFAINTGLTLNTFLHDLPFKAGLGIGYSNVNYSYTPGWSPTISVYTDATKGITIGVGIDDLIRLGVGYTLKWINFFEGTPHPPSPTYAPDFGAIVQIPTIDIISKIGNRPDFVLDNVVPVVNFTLGYSARNMGDYASYGPVFLPRESELGWSLEAGFKTSIMDRSWEWISFTLLRQANASLVNRYGYSKGLGNFQVYDNLIAGQPTGDILTEKGWQLQLGEFIYYREGSVTDPGFPTFITSGWGIKLNGLATTLVFLHGLEARDIPSFLNHLDLRFEYGKANGTGFRELGGKSFETLSLIIK